MSPEFSFSLNNQLDDVIEKAVKRNQLIGWWNQQIYITEQLLFFGLTARSNCDIFFRNYWKQLKVFHFETLTETYTINFLLVSVIYSKN